jgi:phospholipid/cholesterol/gamma-HCH transport system substrate-binding protein
MKFIKNAVASIASDGLVGNMIVNIQSSKSCACKIWRHSKSEERLTTEDLLKTLNKTNNNAEQITANIQKFLKNK